MQPTTLRQVRDRLRGRRVWLGLTQADVGVAVGYTATHIGAIEGNGSASAAAVVAVSAFLTALEAGTGKFEPSGVHGDVALLNARVMDLESRLATVEAARANGHAQHPFQLALPA